MFSFVYLQHDYQGEKNVTRKFFLLITQNKIKLNEKWNIVVLCMCAYMWVSKNVFSSVKDYKRYSDIYANLDDYIKDMY